MSLATLPLPVVCWECCVIEWPWGPGGSGGGGTGAEHRVALWHTSSSGPEEKLRAMWHASLLRESLGPACASGPPRGEAAIAALAHATWPEVHAALADAGWDMATVHLDGDGGYLDFGPRDGPAGPPV